MFPDRIPYVVLEIGQNHGGDMVQLREIIAAAADTGTDAVKFQAFQPLDVYDGPPPVKMFGLTREQLVAAIGCAHLAGLDAIVTPLAPDWVPVCVSVGVKALKVASFDINYGPLISACAKTGLPVIVSCGAATWRDIDNVQWMMDGEGNRKLFLLDCDARYPAPEFTPDAMIELHRWTRLPVGYSCHTPDPDSCIHAARCGAVIIEAHFTLRDDVVDAAVSFRPKQVKEMIRAIRRESSTPLVVPGYLEMQKYGRDPNTWRRRIA